MATTFTDPNIRWLTISEFEAMRLRKRIDEMYGPGESVDVDPMFQNQKPVSAETRRRMSEKAKARCLNEFHP